MLANAPCALCAGPIQDGEAWMANAMTGSVAHAGCVYRDEHEPERRERWQPSAMSEAPDGERSSYGMAGTESSER